MDCLQMIGPSGMKPVRRKLAWALLLLLTFSATAVAEKISDIQPQGYVTDLAQVIDPSTRQKIEMLGTEVQQKTGAQIAVVTVNSLEGRVPRRLRRRSLQAPGHRLPRGRTTGY